jgi:hypothetical protein
VTKKLLIEGYRPSGKETFVERGYQSGYRSGGAEKPPSPPKPPTNAPSAVVKPKTEG